MSLIFKWLSTCILTANDEYLLTYKNTYRKNMAKFQLDITKDHCPITFVKTKIELAKLQKDDILEVLLLEGEPLENVPRTSQEQGYNVLDVSQVEGAIYKVTIQK